MKALDAYNPGSSLTIPSMYRKVGETSWTDVSSGSTFAGEALANYEVCIGVNQSAAGPNIEAYGDCFNYPVPCQETSTAEYTDARNDALETDLTATLIDMEDSKAIIDSGTTSDRIDIDAGDTAKIEIRYSGASEEDFGNIHCGELSNVVVFKINTTAYDEEDVTLTYKGRSMTRVTAPTSLAQAAGFQMVAFEFPVLESNPIYYLYLDLPADDTENPSGSDGGNVTVSLYDSAQFLNQDTNTVECGVNDEDGKDIGAAAADEATVRVEDDA